ncbi:hypothetical protein [Leclercia sp. AS011]|uniref:hypothetical protein n=1 Tax=Leclercia sp. AS011 TaxID=3081257 RepID=UPI00301B0299
MADFSTVLNSLTQHPDFLKVYNDRNGTNLTKLKQSQLFTVGDRFQLVTITFADGSGELRLCDGFYDISFNSKTYLAVGDFIDIKNPTRTKDINNNGMSIRVSNVRPEYITLIQAGKFDRAIVNVELVFTNPQSGVIEANYGTFRGEIDSAIVTLDYSNKEAVTNETEFVLNSFWAVLEKNGRSHASDGVHRSHVGNENDTFFAKIGKWNSEQWKMKKK